MEEKSKKMAQLFQEIQEEFESAVSKKFKEHGLEPELEWVVGPDDARIAMGPCVSQNPCDRCKPQLCLGKGICEAKHVCGHRCRWVGNPCMAQCSGFCYSQPTK